MPLVAFVDSWLSVMSSNIYYNNVYVFAYTEQRLIQINNHHEKCKYIKFSCQKFWWLKKKSYLCIRFRERTRPQAKRDNEEFEIVKERVL